jgi:inositol oxygenase
MTVETFRNYEDTEVASVRETYRVNHEQQTVAFVQQAQQKYQTLDRQTLGMWEVLEYLNEVIDESDPDTSATQLEHALQTAEMIRQDGHPRWMILTGLIHDAGKMLTTYGEPQWAVVGDTFVVGCQFSQEIVYPEYFANNPNIKDPRYNTEFGMYESHCGLDNVLMSWGHDEYLYYVVKDYLPIEALAMIRYHSFYAWHRHGAYRYLMNKEDQLKLEWVKKFNPYDLYSKADDLPKVGELKAYYQDLIAEFFPQKLRW